MAKEVKILLIIFAVVLLLAVSALFVNQAGEDKGIIKDEQGIGISEMEKQNIEDWLVENGLNQYGDPKDTVYLGGTPLFNESTGESIERYEYIFKNHPDKPWLLK